MTKTPYLLELGKNDKRLELGENNPFAKVRRLKERFRSPEGYRPPPTHYESSPYEMWVDVNYIPNESTIRIYFKREEDLIIARLMV